MKNALPPHRAQLIAVFCFFAITTCSISSFREVLGLLSLRSCASRAGDRISLVECARQANRSLIRTTLEPAIMTFILDTFAEPQEPLAKAQSRMERLVSNYSPFAPLTGYLLRLLGLYALLSVGHVIVMFALKRSEKSARNTARPKARKRRILVIDDDPLFAETAASLLERRGFLVDRADSFESAKTLLSTRTYDRIFCDYFLNDGVGTDVGRLIERSTADDQLVLISGADKKTISSTCERSYPYLPKPCAAKDLLKTAMGDLSGLEFVGSA